MKPPRPLNILEILILVAIVGLLIAAILPNKSRPTQSAVSPPPAAESRSSR